LKVSFLFLYNKYSELLEHSKQLESDKQIISANLKQTQIQARADLEHLRESLSEAYGKLAAVQKDLSIVLSHLSTKLACD
jgi:hypothetical protein